MHLKTYSEEEEEEGTSFCFKGSRKMQPTDVDNSFDLISPANLHC